MDPMSGSGFKSQVFGSFQSGTLTIGSEETFCDFQEKKISNMDSVKGCINIERCKRCAKEILQKRELSTCGCID